MGRKSKYKGSNVRVLPRGKCLKEACIVTILGGKNFFIDVNLISGFTFCDAELVLSPELATLSHDPDVLVPEQENIKKSE